MSTKSKRPQSSTENFLAELAVRLKWATDADRRQIAVLKRLAKADADRADRVRSSRRATKAFYLKSSN